MANSDLRHVAADNHRTWGEGYFPAYLGHLVLAYLFDSRRYELGSDVTFAEFFFSFLFMIQMLLGLRGTGKTVLLNRFEQLAISHKLQSSFVAAPDDRSLVELLYPKMHQVLRKLSMVENAKEVTFNAMRGLRSFASAFKIKVGDVSIAVDPALGP